MKKKFSIFILMLIAAGWAATEATDQSGSGAVLAIHITNGTAGSTVPEGTPVTVLVYHGDHIAKEAEVETDAQGNCTVADIPTGADYVAVAQARHSNMAFSSSPLQLNTGKDRYELEFQVFDVAHDNSIIKAGAHHLVVKKVGSNIQVIEYIQLINDTDKAVLSDTTDDDDRPIVVQIDLPKKAVNLTFSGYFNPDAVVRTATGFYDTMAIPPGSYQAVFSYDVPLSGETTEFTKTITLPTQSLMILIQKNAGITANLGTPAGQMTMQDGIPTDYYKVNASPGSSYTFKVEGVPTPKSQQHVWIILGVIFAVAAAAVLIRLFKSSKSA